MRILSWNVNGIRSVQRKGFCEWLFQQSPDILCVQESKAHPDQLDMELLHPRGYMTYWSSAEKKGYSGVGIFTKHEPLKVSHGFGVERFDREGRIVIAEFPEFILANIYFPNGKASEERLRYKLDFYEETLRFTEAWRAQGKKYIVCGDYNTAHQPSKSVAQAAPNRFNIWSDRSAASHSFNSADLTHSYKLDQIPTQILQLTE